MLKRRRILSEFQYPKYLQILKDGISACKRIFGFYSMSILIITLIYKMICPKHVDIRFSKGFRNAANIATFYKFVLKLQKIHFKCIKITS